ncbi:MAG: hypothetical protein NC126_03770 [Clostridium sp.]|nr:hypothetical protein [Clostridium sp.]
MGNMMEPKILFVKQFLAALCREQVNTIPINNAEFKAGIQNMADYYYENIQEFGPHAEQIGMLFLKYTTRGDFNQFSRIIESFNGRIVSLENPHYIKANLKLEQEYIEELLDNDTLEIEQEQFKQLVNCFRKGAKA